MAEIVNKETDMIFRSLTTLEVTRMMGLASKAYRPPQIIKLADEIEKETKAAEIKASITGVIDPLVSERIVEMKLRLDILYDDWTTGKIE